MTHVGTAPVASTAVQEASFVEWGSVFAGAALAAAISFVLLTFGTAIGLSATSPWPNSGASAKVIASIAVFWAMTQQIGSFMIGGYVAGRMRSRWREPGHEAEFRDGLHGGLVWAVGVLIGAALFLSSAGAAVRTGAQAVSGATAVAAGSTNDPLDLALDTMLRPMTTAQATPATSPPSPGSGASASAPTPRARAASAPADESRNEMSRILATAVAGGSLSEPSRAYLSQQVAQRAGISQQEADKRVTEAFNGARETADKARRAAVLTGFVTAAGLILSLGAAWWAALKGGQHRDNSIPARFVFGDRRRLTPTS